MLECVRKHRQEKAQESRRKLTETALSLFARNGFAGTNMRAISRGAGMADGLVYHYFPAASRSCCRRS
jgi:AcrR family transcriptional regulator